MKKKIDWLAVLQGYSMLLVVMGHVDLTGLPYDSNTPIASEIHRVIYTFHMPLFIFISGWLFYFTCIGKEKSYKDMLVSKVKRLAVPFMAFTLATMLLKMLFPSLMQRVVDMKEIINTFVLFSSNPLAEMWFIVVLFELMLLYPLYKVITKNIIVSIMAFSVTVILNGINPPIPYYFIGILAYMSPFFLAGIYCCKHEWQKYLGNVGALILSGGLFLICNVLEFLPQFLEIITVSIGICFSSSLCIMIAKYLPKLFCSFRDYTFQIFLMGIFFQMAIRWTFVRWGNDMLFVPMWLLSVVIGIYAPTFIAKIIDKKTPKYVKMCFGL